MMKHKVFLAGMLASLLALGMMVVSCGGDDDGGGGTETPGGGTETPGGGTETPGGGTETPNTEAKKIKFTNAPIVSKDQNGDEGLVGVFTKGTAINTVVTDALAGNGTFKARSSIDLTGDGTVTVSLRVPANNSGGDLWTGYGEYDIYILVWAEGKIISAYKKAGVTINSAITTIDSALTNVTSSLPSE